MVVLLVCVCMCLCVHACMQMQRLERSVGVVQALTNGLSEREANDALTANVSDFSPQP